MSSNQSQGRFPKWMRLSLGERFSPSRHVLLASDTEEDEEDEEEQEQEYNEKTMRTLHRQECAARKARGIFWRGFIIAIACALILDFVVISWFFTPKGSPVYYPHDLTEASASLAKEYDQLFDSTTQIDFNAANDFKSTPPGEKLDELWRTFIPRSAGLVVLPLDFAAAHGLRRSVPDIHNTSQEVYRIATYHHLHCLDIIRHTIQLPRWNVSYGYPITMSHVEHCIEAIRQGLLCNPDLTLTSSDDYANYGYKDVHQCRNYNRLYAWTEEHRFRGAYAAMQRAIPDIFPSALHRNRLEDEES